MITPDCIFIQSKFPKRPVARPLLPYPLFLLSQILCFYLLLLFSIPSFGQQQTLSRQVIFEQMSRQSANVFLEDSFGFIWIGSNGLYRYDGHSIQPYRPIMEDSTQTSIGVVQALIEDSKKRIWIGTSSGLYRYERTTDRLTKHLAFDSYRFDRKGFGVLSLLEDKAGRIWVGGRQHLYVKENPGEDSFRVIEGIDLGMRVQGASGFLAIVEDNRGGVYAATNKGLWLVEKDFPSQHFLPAKWQNTVAEFQILDAAIYEGNVIWLATSDGLWTFETKGKAFVKKELSPYPGMVISKVLIGNEQEVWFVSENYGLFRLKNNGQFEHFAHDPDNPYGIIDNIINALMLDRFNNLWIGTWIGINRINFGQQKFPFYQIDPGPYRHDNCTFRVMQDSLGGFWFRLIRKGLGYAPGLGEKFETLLQPEHSSTIEEIKNFCVDADGNVWVITLTKGLYLFPKGQKEYRHIDLGDSMKVAYTLVILSDRTDDRYLWFSSNFGLCRVNRFTYERKWFYPTKDLPHCDNDFLGNFDQSEDGDFWCLKRCGSELQIIRFDYEKEEFVEINELKGGSGQITFNRTWQIKAIPGNKVWVGTANGLIVIDVAQKTYEQVTQKDGLPTQNVMSITPDLEGNIWFSGNHKICKYDGETNQCYDGRADIERFNYSCASLGKDGRVTFGGRNGIYSFYPDEITFEKDTLRPKAHLNNFKVFNKKRHLGSAYELVKEITLPFKDNVIVFEFSTLHFLRSNLIRYRHKLEGFEEEWVETGSDKRQATYTNLSSGDYTFMFQAANADGVWGEVEAVQLTVKPPFYRSWAAYVLYVLYVSGLVWVIWRYELRRQLGKAKVRQLQELDAIKTRLYTNITHEFRTPLTIILGMTDQLVQNPKEWLLEGARMIKRNGNRLLLLVNQMLDLSKLETGAMPLKMVNEDVIKYLRYINESFHSFAELKGISLHFLPSIDEYHMDYDPDKLMDIFSNLVSNAIKYTPEDGQVYVQVQEKELEKLPFLELKVMDTGIGMDKWEVEKVFDRFYQVDGQHTRKGEGTGIGLALTKELVRLMEGEIMAESKKGKGSTFTVLLPVTQNAPPQAQEKEAFVENKIQPLADLAVFNSVEEIAPEKTNQPLLLIIEDNQDVTQYLISCVNKEYQLVTATNGQTGIDKAIELVPDIIVSDVMMPEKDGFEVCSTLRQDERTSHIPIILLTAKADISSKLQGLEKGADAYLAKPFNKEELNIRLKKLLELRQALQQRYGNLAVLKKTSIQSPTPEDAFLAKIRDLIEKHISDPSYGQVQVCKAIGMSRSQLFRKVKALTGRSASLFVRSIRLQKARELLLTTDLNVSEIAYDIGFTSPAFFTRAFSEEFGMPPSDVR